MKNVTDVACAIKNGVRYIGFVIEYPESPRSVSRQTVSEITSEIRKTHSGNFEFIGVFVDTVESDVASIARETGIQIIQLHGNESAHYIKRVKNRTGLPIWKYVEINNENDIEKIDEYRDIVAKIVIDRGKGTGLNIESRLLDIAVAKGCNGIAGGIICENVSEYIQKYNPEITDVSSGIEKEKGIKSVELIKKFMTRVKETHV